MVNITIQNNVNFQNIENEIANIALEALQSAKPGIESVINIHAGGTSYYKLTKGYHPFSRVTGSVTTSFISKQTGAFRSSIKLIGPILSGNKIIMTLIIEDNFQAKKARWLDVGTSRMLGRNWILSLREKIEIDMFTIAKERILAIGRSYG